MLHARSALNLPMFAIVDWDQNLPRFSRPRTVRAVIVNTRPMPFC